MHSAPLKALTLLFLAPFLTAQTIDPAEISAAASQLGASLPSSVDVAGALSSLSSLTQDPAIRSSASAFLASNPGFIASQSAALESAIASHSGIAGAASSAVAGASSKVASAKESATKATGAVASSKSTGGVGAQPTAAIMGAGAAMVGILGVAAML